MVSIQTANFNPSFAIFAWQWVCLWLLIYSWTGCALSYTQKFMTVKLCNFPPLLLYSRGPYPVCGPIGRSTNCLLLPQMLVLNPGMQYPQLMQPTQVRGQALGWDDCRDPLQGIYRSA